MEINNKVKHCPKCGGYLYLEDEAIIGYQEVCVNCGYRRSLKTEVFIPKAIKNSKGGRPVKVY